MIIDAGQPGHGLDVVRGFVASLVGADLVGRPETVVEVLARQVAALTGGTVLVVLERERDAPRVVASAAAQPSAGDRAAHEPADRLAGRLADHLAGVLTLVTSSGGGSVRLDGDVRVGAAGDPVVAAQRALAEVGVHRVDAVPLVAAGVRIGTVLALDAALDDDHAVVDDVVGIAGVVHGALAALEAERIRADQLQHALTSRIVVEQAKGMLAEQGRLTPDEAFQALRAHCRRTNQRVQAVAGDVIARRIGWAAISSS